jgi:hypothetical protein
MASLKGDFTDLGGDPMDRANYFRYDAPYPMGEAFLGKLGFKAEPAGKVRVFAMVDA